jgi:hypothetical protein
MKKEDNIQFTKDAMFVNGIRVKDYRKSYVHECVDCGREINRGEAQCEYCRLEL